MAGTRNKNAGNIWELRCVKYIKPIFPNACSSRWANQRLDGKGVDICNEDGLKLPVNIQCKTLSSKPNYSEVLNHMPEGEFNVFFLKKTKKSEKGLFVREFEEVSMYYDTFIKYVHSNCGNSEIAISDLRNPMIPATTVIKLSVPNFINLLRNIYRTYE